MAEQLALDQFLGDGRAVHLHEPLVAPRRQGVDRPRHQLLAGAVLSEDENPPVGGRRDFDLLSQLADRTAVADQCCALVQLLAQLPYAFVLLLVGDRVAQRQRHLLERQRLLDEVEGAEAARLVGQGHVGVPRDHDDARRAGLGDDLFKDRETITPLEPDIEEDGVERGAAHHLQAALPGLRHLDAVPLVFQDIPQRVAHSLLIVDNEDPLLGHAGYCSSERGWATRPPAAR